MTNISNLNEAKVYERNESFIETRTPNGAKLNNANRTDRTQTRLFI